MRCSKASTFWMIFFRAESLIPMSSTGSSRGTPSGKRFCTSCHRSSSSLSHTGLSMRESERAGGAVPGWTWAWSAGCPEASGPWGCKGGLSWGRSGAAPSPGQPGATRARLKRPARVCACVCSLHPPASLPPPLGRRAWPPRWQSLWRSPCCSGAEPPPRRAALRLRSSEQGHAHCHSCRRRARLSHPIPALTFTLAFLLKFTTTPQPKSASSFFTCSEITLSCEEGRGSEWAGGRRARLYLDEPPRLQEGQAVLGPVDKLLDLFAEFGQLLSDFKVGDHTLLVGNLNAVILFFIFLYSCKQQRLAVGLKTHTKKENMGKSGVERDSLSTTAGRAR